MLRDIRTREAVRNAHRLSIVLTLGLTAALSAALCTPAVANQAANQRFRKYVALGDSTPAAPLLGYLHEPGKLPAVECTRGRVSYPIIVRNELVARGLLDKKSDSFVNATCSGASTEAITNHAKGSIDKNTDVITLTGGAIDTINPKTDIKNSVRKTLDVISDLASENARIAVTGYLLYTGGTPEGGEEWSDDSCRADPSGTIYADSAAVRKDFLRINKAVEQAVTEFDKEKKKAGQRVAFVDITKSPHNTKDKSACNTEVGAPAWSPPNPPKDGSPQLVANNNDAIPAHPTELASEEYARLILETIPGATSTGSGQEWRSHGPYGLQSKPDFTASGSWLSGHQPPGTKLANPAKLPMHSYVPDGLPEKKPLVVALDGCGGTLHNEAAIEHSGLRKLADEKQFGVLFPLQTMQGHPVKCFRWWETKPGIVERTSGVEQRGVQEMRSIHDMVVYMLDRYGFDKNRVFLVGGSAGGGMVANLLAAYPEMFSAGSILAGLPAGCVVSEKGVPKQPEGTLLNPDENSAWGCMKSTEARHNSTKGWGDRAREIYRDFHDGKDNTGNWPRVQIMHGKWDGIVSPTSADALTYQWTNLWGLEKSAPSDASNVDEWGQATTRYKKGDTTAVEVLRFSYRGHEVAGGFMTPEPAITKFFGLDG